MIIIEGTDLLGKTTLAHALVKALNDKELPHVYQHLSKLPDCFDVYWGYIPLIRRHIVQDRFHLSRQAYGTVFNNQKLFNPMELSLLKGALAKVGAFVVLCTGTKEFIKSQWGREEMYDLNGVIKVNDVFYKMSSDHHIHLCGQQWASDDCDEIVKKYLVKQEQLDVINQRKSS